MAQLVQELNLKDNGYSQGIKSAQEALKKLAEENGVAGASFQNVSREVGSAKKGLASLLTAYSQLSAEAKNSQVGQSMKGMIEQTKQYISEMTVNAERANREIEKLQEQAKKQVDIEFGVSDTQTTVSSFEALGKALNDARNNFLEFSAQYQALSDADKNTEFGEKLKSQIDAASKSVEELTKKNEEIKSSLKSVEDAAKGNNKAQGESKSAFDQLNSKLSEAKKKFLDLAAAYEDLSDEAKKGGAGENIKKQMEAAGKSVDALRTKVENVNKSLSAAGKGGKSGSFMDGLKSSFKDMDKNKLVTDILGKAGLGEATGMIEGLGAAMGGGAAAGAAALATGVGAVVAGVGATVSVTKEAIAKSAEFGQSMAQLGALCGVSGKELDSMREQVKNVGKDTTTAFSEVARNFALVGSALPELLNDKQGMEEVSRAAITLSKAGLMGLEDATNSLTSTMAQFGKKASDSAGVVDVLANSSKLGSADIGAVAETIQRCGTAAAQAGVNLEQTAAMTEVLAAKGLKGAEAGTALRNVLMNMSTKGIDEINPKVVGVQTALENLSKHAQDATWMVQTFGQEGATAASIIAQGLPTYNELVEHLTDAGSAAEMAKQNGENLATAWTKTKTMWENFLASFNVDEADGAMMQLVQTIQDIITATQEMFDQIQQSQTVQDAMTALGEVFDVLGTAIQVVISICGDIIDCFLELVDADGELSDSFNLISAACEILKDALHAIEFVVWAVKKAISVCVDQYKAFKDAITQAILKIPFFEKIKEYIDSIIGGLKKALKVYNQFKAVIKQAMTDDRNNKKGDEGNSDDGKSDDSKNDKNDKEVEKKEGLVQKLEKQIKDLKAKRDAATSKSEINSLNKQIAAKQKELDKLQDKKTGNSNKKETPTEKYNKAMGSANMRQKYGLYDSQDSANNEKKAIEAKISATETYINELAKDEDSVKKNKKKLEELNRQIVTYKNRLKQVTKVVTDHETVKKADEDYEDAIDKLIRNRDINFETEDSYQAKYIDAMRQLIDKYKSLNNITNDLRVVMQQKQGEIDKLDLMQRENSVEKKRLSSHNDRQDIMQDKPRANDVYKEMESHEQELKSKRDQIETILKLRLDKPGYEELISVEDKIKWIQKNAPELGKLDISPTVVRDLESINVSAKGAGDQLLLTKDQLSSYLAVTKKLDEYMEDGFEVKALQEYNKYIKENITGTTLFYKSISSIKDFKLDKELRKLADLFANLFNTDGTVTQETLDMMSSKLKELGIDIEADEKKLGEFLSKYMKLDDRNINKSKVFNTDIQNPNNNSSVQYKGDKSNFMLPTESYEKVNKRASKYQTSVGRSTNGMNTNKTDKMQDELDKLLDKYKEMEDSAIEELQNKMENGLTPTLDDSKFFGEMEGLQKQIDSLHDDIQDRLLFEVKMEGLNDTLDGLNSLSSFGENIATLGDQFDQIADSSNGAAAAFEAFGLIIQTVQSIIETYNTVMMIVNALTDLFATKQTVSAAATEAAGAANVTKATEDATSIIATEALAAANTTLEASYLTMASAAIFAAHASIPFVGVGLATGFATQMMATMGTLTATAAALSSAGMMANGGIVGGDSFHGDTEIIRANKGEMILNNSEQRNLFSLLENGMASPFGGGSVDFRIKGDVLYGVLDNHKKIKGRTGHKISL